MEFIDLLLIMISIAVSVLSAILFFKTWKMCNNIARLTEKFAPKTPEELKANEDSSKSGYIFLGIIGFVIFTFLLYFALC